MEKIKEKKKGLEIMTLKDVAVELVVSCAALEKENPIYAAYMAGYIARYIETADKPNS